MTRSIFFLALGAGEEALGAGEEALGAGEKALGAASLISSCCCLNLESSRHRLPIIVLIIGYVLDDDITILLF